MDVEITASDWICQGLVIVTGIFTAQSHRRFNHFLEHWGGVCFDLLQNYVLIIEFLFNIKVLTTLPILRGELNLLVLNRGPLDVGVQRGQTNLLSHLDRRLDRTLAWRYVNLSHLLPSWAQLPDHIHLQIPLCLNAYRFLCLALEDFMDLNFAVLMPDRPKLRVWFDLGRVAVGNDCHKSVFLGQKHVSNIILSRLFNFDWMFVCVDSHSSSRVVDNLQI